MAGLTCYLLHLEPPYRHARHYLGCTDDLPERLAQHARGQGARLLEVARAAGCQWRLARVWAGARADERRLKNRGGAARLCPICCGQLALSHPHPLTVGDIIRHPTFGAGVIRRITAGCFVTYPDCVLGCEEVPEGAAGCTVTEALWLARERCFAIAGPLFQISPEFRSPAERGDRDDVSPSRRVDRW